MTRSELQTLIITQLRNYAEDRRELNRLEDTLMDLTGMTTEEMIDDIGYEPVSGASDRTFVDELVNSIARLRTRLDRLEACVMDLPDRQRDVLVWLYFEGKRWTAVEDEQYLGRNTIAYHRKRALDEMIRMPPYRYLLYVS